MFANQSGNALYNLIANQRANNRSGHWCIFVATILVMADDGVVSFDLDGFVITLCTLTPQCYHWQPQNVERAS